MSKETSKAMRRRFIEDQTGVFPWMKILSGKGIDVGCGPDKLPFDECRGFDMEDGDANKLHEYFKKGEFDYLHGSQILEHTIDAAVAVRSWLKVVKPGGHLVISIPDFVLYEGLRWPSAFNPDHKSTWSMSLPASPCKQHCLLPQWLEQFSDESKVLLCRTVDNNFDYTQIGKHDQTWHEDEGVEAFIEFVLQKL